MRLLVLALVVPSLTLAACGGTTTPPAAPAPSHSPTADGNRQAAEAKARSLLSLVQLPAGAQPMDAAPPSLTGPPMRPADDSLIDRPSFWRIGLPVETTLAFVKAHPPRGLSTAGSSTSGTPAAQVYGLDYGAADTDAWRWARLEISIAPDAPAGSVVRADGMAIWLDPQPRRDDPAGLRVTVAGGCPADDRDVAGVTNPGQPDLDRTLLPAGSPTGGLVCEYDQGKRLAGHRTLDADAAGRLDGRARALPLSHSLGGPRSCPAEFGTAAVVVFAYPGRADADLWLGLSGCATVRNGHVWTDAGDLPAAVQTAR